MRWIRWVLSAVVGLVALVLIALWLIPAETVARLAAAEFQRMTGRTLVIDGPVRATLLPPGVRTGAVTMANAAWSDQGPMLTARQLEVRLDIGAALSGRLAVQSVELDGLRLVLERAADGQVNWQLAPVGAAPAPDVSGTDPVAPAAGPLGLASGRLTDGQVIWIDHATGQRTTVTGLSADITLPATDGDVAVQANGTLGATPLRLLVRANGAQRLLQGQPVQVSLDLAAGGNMATFAGRAGLSPLSADGTLTADLADLRALADLGGTTPPDLPEGLGRRERKVSGKLTLAPAGSVHLREGEVLLDANRLAVSGDATFDGPRPRILAQVEAGALVLAGLDAAPADTGTAASAADAGWSRSPIDASVLGLADAEIAFRAASVDLGSARMGTTRLMLTIDRARAVIEARELRLWDGLVTGQFVMNNRSGLSVGGDLTLAGLAMQPALTDLAGWDRLITRGDVGLKFLGVGNSVAAIMASLSGEGRFALGKGELRGFDLLGMLRTLDVGFVGEGQKTIFDGISSSFVIRNGVATTSDLRMAAPYLQVAGQGTVGLGAQVLDLRITPVALTKEDGTGGVRVPLIVSGPWSSPGFRLDLRALADQELAEERARLEAAAKAELERGAARLGVERQEGESLEDAAKRRAQDAIEAEGRRALDRLLGGR